MIPRTGNENNTGNRGGQLYRGRFPIPAVPIRTRQIPHGFPFGTLGVNIIGCFLIGLVFGLADRGNLAQEWRLFLATGILGGFTTFSAFSNETVGMLRDGQLIDAGAYILSSVLFGLAATFLGISLTKLF